LSSLFQNGGMFRLAFSILYDDDYKEGVHIIIEPCRLDIPDQCEQELRSRLNQARVIRMLREQREQPLSSFRNIFLPNFELLEIALLDDLYKTDRVGLIGEIITEIIIEQCFCNFQIIHHNWRRTGHSNQEGMDFIGIWNRNGNLNLVFIDSKFCGETSKNYEDYVRARAKEALEGMENYQENEIKLGKAIKWIAEYNLRKPISLQELSSLFNLFESMPGVNSASIIISLPLNVQLLVQNPPDTIISTRSRAALAFVDLANHDFLRRLVDENES